MKRSEDRKAEHKRKGGRPQMDILKSSFISMCIGLAALVGLASPAQAKIYEYFAYDASIDDHSFYALYNSDTGDLKVTLGLTGLDYDGGYIVLTPGPLPNNTTNYPATLFWDANTKRTTAKAYLDFVPGVNVLDLWNNSVDVDDSGPGRTVTLSLNVAALNNIVLPSPWDQGWVGAQFGDQIGVWSAAYKNTSFTYDSQGFMTDHDFPIDSESWFDRMYEPTSVNEPAILPLAFFGLGLIALHRRRRSGVS